MAPKPGPGSYRPAPSWPAASAVEVAGRRRRQGARRNGAAEGDGDGGARGSNGRGLCRGFKISGGKKERSQAGAWGPLRAYPADTACSLPCGFLFSVDPCADPCSH
jgi:hypothetical protein